MAADGANPQPLIDKAGTGEGVGAGHWLPDGSGLVYRSGKDQQLYVFNPAAKSSRRLTDELAVMPILNVSPDGKWVVYQSTIAGNVDLRAVPFEGGRSRVVVATPHQDYHPWFSPSGRWLYFHLDHKNLWRVPGPAQGWHAAQPERITNFGRGLNGPDHRVFAHGQAGYGGGQTLLP
jgi:Tol biopolymer transport system component